MGKHIKRILYVFAVCLPLFLIGFVVYHIIALPDQFLNKYFFEKAFGKSFPLLGFITALIIAYLIGTFFETKWGRHLATVLKCIPFFGQLIVLQGSVSSALQTLKSGCLCMPFASNTPFRSAAITSVRRTKYDYLITVAFLGLLPDVRQFEPSESVFAREVIENGKTKHRLYSIATAMQLEFGAGITLAEDALSDFVKVPLLKVLKDEGYIKE